MQVNIGKNIQATKGNYIRSNEIQLDQYMKKNSISNTNRVKYIFIVLKLIESYIILYYHVLQIKK